MTVYVDALKQHAPPANAQARRAGAKHGHRWRHLLCEPGKEEDMHRIAKAAGMRPEWFQKDGSPPHYDLVPPRREAAVRAGAVEINRAGMRDLFMRWRQQRAEATR